ncbi:MAG TPA: GNAT family N-acetyltransferase [Usitatibacter sp.]
MPVTLETPRLLLRKLRESDWDPFAAMYADADVMRYIGTGVTLNREDTWRSIANMLGHWQLRGFGMWAIEVKETGELAGRAGFIDPPGWPGFELGWLLGKPYWGRGYASEAARAALRHGFDVLGRERIISLIRPDNARSIRVAEGLGETLAGETELLGGKSLVYEIRRKP